MQELGKLNLRKNFILNELDKYMSLNINSNLSLTDSFEF